MTQITLVGAGSVEFTRILLADLSDFPELAEATVVLHDIDPERLATAERIAAATNAATGARLRIATQLDRRAALEGADFVVNEIQVGGFEATLRDFEIPTRHGLRQTIGDTLGIGGIFRALRTIPVLLAIADDMADVCPQAILLNYTNPMAMLCWAVARGGRHTRIVGLCHSVQNTHEQLAAIVGVPDFWLLLQKLEPFGSGNPVPVFVARNAKLVQPPRVLKEKHLKLRVVAGDRNSNGSKFQRGFDALGWRMAERLTPESLLLGSTLDLAFAVDYNEHPEFGGVQLNLLDFASAETAASAAGS